MILSDFSLPDPPAWRCFTDRVMGGLSDAGAVVEEFRGRRALVLRGHVRLENRGGFVQAALPLGGRGAPLDAARLRVVRLTVCGTAPATFVHLRSADTLLPWSHYAAPFALPAAWDVVEVPFAAFEGSGSAGRLDPSVLTRIGIVAGKAAGDVELGVARVELA